MNPTETVLQVFLKQSQSLVLLLPRQEAFKIMDGWKEGNVVAFSGVTTDGANYCLRTSEIAALVALPHQVEPQQPRLHQGVVRQQGIPPIANLQFPPRA